MSAAAIAIATSVELVLIGGGLVAIWQLALSPAARAARHAPRVAEWPLPLVEFLHYLLLIICATLVGNLAGTVALKFRPVGPDAKAMVITALSHLGMLAGIAAFKMAVERVPLRTAAVRLTDFSAGAITFLAILPIVTGANLLWRGLLQACGLPLEKQELVGMFVNARSPLLLALMIGLATLTAPAAEELVFRAGFFRFLRTRLPRWAALVAPACLFAALHQNLASFAPLVVLGVLFSLAYERTGRIATTIVAHGLFNRHTVVLLMVGVGV